MKKKEPKIIADLFPGMEFKIRGSEELGYHKLLVKYSEERMSVENIRTKKRLELSGFLPISSFRDPKNR